MLLELIFIIPCGFSDLIFLKTYPIGQLKLANEVDEKKTISAPKY